MCVCVCRCLLQPVFNKYMMSVVRSFVVVQPSVAEVAQSWLLKVEGVMLNTLANTVLALDGITGHVVSVCPSLILLNTG